MGGGSLNDPPPPFLRVNLLRKRLVVRGLTHTVKKIQNARRILEAIYWSGLIFVYVLQYLPTYIVQPDFEACFHNGV